MDSVAGGDLMELVPTGGIRAPHPFFRLVKRRGFVENKPTVQTCRWAEPTLYQEGPYWLDAWNMPWTCRRDGDSRLLDDTDVCANCPRWQPRTAKGVAWNFEKTTT